ncbi:hypothetical protein NQ314_006671 [Rhamnusium bicolor]|uniref:Myb/SANT-like DNA-binding domain-containing protein n=1 Tax=Rhamnusium bicolor TaxID=1586634 RepID=A0AAV8YYD4_9CUCU|nr:hypothetical protein NQ314_006671 [Rhamnusium bicolor]
MVQLIEFIILPEDQPSTSLPHVYENQEVDSYKWNHANTLAFLDLYKTYRKQVGSLKIKNLKRMCEIIAEELQVTTKQKITVANCENRWKHLERSYKKYVDNNKKTGRGRRDFEYANELNDILGPKRNINPVILLSSETLDTGPPNVTSEINLKKNLSTYTAGEDLPTHATEKENMNTNQSYKVPNKNQKKYINKIVKADILKDIRRDRQAYYKRRLDVEERKLQEKMKKNEILQGRNDLIRESLKKTIGL